MKAAAGPEAAQQVLALRRGMVNSIREEDPTMTDEIASIELSQRLAEGGGTKSYAFGVVFEAYVWTRIFPSWIQKVSVPNS